MPKRWLVKRRWLVVLEATTYTKIYGQQQFGKWWCVARSQPTSETFFVVKLYSRKIFPYVFCVQKYFYNENKVWQELEKKTQSSASLQLLEASTSITAGFHTGGAWNSPPPPPPPPQKS